MKVGIFGDKIGMDICRNIRDEKAYQYGHAVDIDLKLYDFILQRWLVQRVPSKAPPPGWCIW